MLTSRISFHDGLVVVEGFFKLALLLVHPRRVEQCGWGHIRSRETSDDHSIVSSGTSPVPVILITFPQIELFFPFLLNLTVFAVSLQEAFASSINDLTC